VKGGEVRHAVPVSGEFRPSQEVSATTFHRSAGADLDTSTRCQEVEGLEPPPVVPHELAREEHVRRAHETPCASPLNTSLSIDR
jgi:hypothetical protein